ncbi:hypothetical protein GALMADRAFT_1217888 [Galerina marginata CBS 339.88]|uniref:DUF6533 domain-containing protein n=1 Tax=Galerina marginata (strain CBS 339.88) TaxID=685588 RepID=A0A067SDQ5_GALM3|nr:hypothetical protein GALMADRAFT_1217888 [Galerina marginata CBS 339.88]
MTNALSYDAILHLVQSHLLRTHFDLAASTVIIYDIILTLETECALVWRADWNFIKALYIFQRYLPLIDTVYLTLMYQMEGGLSKSHCRNLYYGAGWLMAAGFASSELILTLRAWAVWNRNRRLTIILPILWVIVWSPVIGVMVPFLRSIEIGDPPYPAFPGCFVLSCGPLLAICFVMLTVWDTLMLGLILVPGIRTYQSGANSRLFDVVYRDGVIYYIYIFVLSIFNVVAITKFPVSYPSLSSQNIRPGIISCFPHRAPTNFHSCQ